MNYSELKQKHTETLNDFPMFFAFGQGQFAEGLVQLGVKEEELSSISGGGFIRSADAEEYLSMFRAFRAESKAYMLDDAFLTDAIKYELANHEFGYTGDPSDALDVLGITLKDERIIACFKAAKAQYMEENKDNF